MPRSNQPRRRRNSAPRGGTQNDGGKPWEDGDGYDLNLVRLGIPSTESAPDGEWAVRSISATNAQKVYTCPGCHHPVQPGIAHLVVWREDAMFGTEAGLRERRHWHSNCWRGRSYIYR